MGSHFNPRWFWKKDDYKRVLKLIANFNKPIYHICSGVSELGDIRLDVRILKVPDRAWRMGSCNVLGDMEHLPFKDGVAGSVICDPPYDYDFCTRSLLINEITRILKPKGKLIFIALWIPSNVNLTLLKNDVWRVGKNRPYFKIMSMFYKSHGQLGDYWGLCATV